MLYNYLREAVGLGDKASRVHPILEFRKSYNTLYYNLWWRGPVAPYRPTLAEKFPGIGASVEHYNKSLTELWHSKRQDAAIKITPRFDHRVKRHWDPEAVLRGAYTEHTYEFSGPPSLSQFVRRAERVELHEAGMSTDLLDVRPTFANTAAMTASARVGNTNVLGVWHPAESPAVRASSTPILTAPFYKPKWRRDLFVVTGRVLPAHTEWGGHLTAAEYVDAARRNLDRRAEVDSQYDWNP
jgi:hypothetical protein